MKKTYLLILGLFTFGTTVVNAQTIANGKLDAWGGTGAPTPTGWSALLNPYVGLLGPDTSVVKRAGQSGSAARLNGVDLTAAGLPIFASLLNLGATGNGQAYTGRPAGVSFYQKGQITSSGTTSGVVTVNLTKWDAAADTAEIIGTASFTLSASQATFKKQAISFTYNNSKTPDSLKIDIVFITDQAGHDALDYFSVDEFNIEQTLNVGTLSTDNNIHVFPTFGNGVVNFSIYNPAGVTIEVMTVNGELVRRIAASGNTVANFSDLAAGFYVYSILDKNQNVLKTGKLVFTK